MTTGSAEGSQGGSASILNKNVIRHDLFKAKGNQ